MQNAQILNLGPDAPRDVDPDTPGVEDRFHTNEMVEQTRSDVRRMRMLVDQQNDDHERRTRILSIVLGILVLTFAGALWFNYSTLKGQKNTVAAMVGLKGFAAGLGDRLNAVEARVTAGLPALTTQMERLQDDMKTNVQTARNQAQSAATQVGQRISADVNHSMQGIQSRMTGLESNQRESSAHVAQLQDQISKLNQQLASMREESSAASEELKQLKESQQTSSRELTGLNERVATNQAAVTTLRNHAERNKIDFGVTGRKPTLIAPDIYLTVKRADVKSQELDAMLQLGDKGRNLPIRGQGIRKPVLFYMPDETRPLELVITDISKDKVSGYLMMPAPMKSASKD